MQICDVCTKDVENLYKYVGQWLCNYCIRQDACKVEEVDPNEPWIVAARSKSSRKGGYTRTREQMAAINIHSMLNKRRLRKEMKEVNKSCQQKL